MASTIFLHWLNKIMLLKTKFIFDQQKCNFYQQTILSLWTNILRLRLHQLRLEILEIHQSMAGQMMLEQISPDQWMAGFSVIWHGSIWLWSQVTFVTGLSVPNVLALLTLTEVVFKLGYFVSKLSISVDILVTTVLFIFLA